MIIRAYKPEDEDQILKLTARDHPDLSLPPRNNVYGDVVIEENDSVVAYGLIGTFAEAIMLMDRTLPLKDRIAIVSEFMTLTLTILRARGIKELHAISTDPKWSKVLTSKYGFNPRDGEALVREV